MARKAVHTTFMVQMNLRALTCLPATCAVLQCGPQGASIRGAICNTDLVSADGLS